MYETKLLFKCSVKKIGNLLLLLYIFYFLLQVFKLKYDEFIITK